MPSFPHHRAPSIWHQGASRLHLRTHQADVAARIMESLTESRIGIFVLDPLTPVLTKEHVRRKSTFWGLGVLLSLTRSLFSLLRCFALVNIV